VIGAYTYDGSGTSVNPPSLIFDIGSDVTILQLYGGTVLITRIDSVAANGVFSHKIEKYTRSQFIRFLSDVVGKRTPTTAPPPGLGRVADWTHQFSKTVDWPVDSKLPVSPSPFDQTFMEALAYMMQYTPNEPETKLPDTGFVEVVGPKSKFVR
jgi:hypothetical protein